MYFKLLPKAGNHSEGKGKNMVIYEAGQVFESDCDLAAMFPNKFVEVEGLEAVGHAQAAAAPEEAKTDVQKAAEEGAKDLKPPADPETSQEEPPKETPPAPEAPAAPAPAGEPLGRNVTKRFQRAVEEDLQVFANGNEFFVVEADDPGRALNDKPLKRKDVLAFIEDYLKD